MCAPSYHTTFMGRGKILMVILCTNVYIVLYVLDINSSPLLIMSFQIDLRVDVNVEGICVF